MENLNLSFTRGFVHFQHAQYNAAKAVDGVSLSARHQTYHWDNIGFDGPVLPGASAVHDSGCTGADRLGHQPWLPRDERGAAIWAADVQQRESERRDDGESDVQRQLPRVEHQLSAERWSVAAVDGAASWQLGGGGGTR